MGVLNEKKCKKLKIVKICVHFLYLGTFKKIKIIIFEKKIIIS